MGRFDGKVVLVTGGARGQGRSHALAFAREGASIVVSDIAAQVATVPYRMSSDADLRETVKMVEALDRRCVAVTADCRDGAAMRQVAATAVEEFGSIDVVLVNHGLLSLSPVVDMSDEVWDDVIDSDLTGVFKSVRAVLPQMLSQNSGRIVVTASMAGRVGLPTVAHYCAAKWGVLGFVKSVAREVAANGITVNAVCPTNVSTDMIHNPEFYALFAPGVDNPTQEEVIPGFQSLNAIPVPWIETIDISNAMLFLASPEARYITGEALHVSAGWNAFNAA
ncbi:MAG: mycofactocin-coupled SDR family oxidoreductase [Pseudonocardia sp.]